MTKPLPAQRSFAAVASNTLPCYNSDNPICRHLCNGRRTVRGLLHAVATSKQLAGEIADYYAHRPGLLVDFVGENNPCLSALDTEPLSASTQQETSDRTPSLRHGPEEPSGS